MATTDLHPGVTLLGKDAPDSKTHGDLEKQGNQIAFNGENYYSVSKDAQNDLASGALSGDYFMKLRSDGGGNFKSGDIFVNKPAPVSTDPSATNAKGYDAITGKYTPPVVTKTITNRAPTINGTHIDTNNQKAPAVITPPASSPSFSLTGGNLTTGSSGDNVKQLQQILGITSDGQFGPQTKSAVMAFQQANGLTVDGIVGPQTQVALAKKASGGNTTTIGNTTSNATPAYDAKTGFLTDYGKSIGAKPVQPGDTGAGNSTTIIQTPQQEIQNINENANADMESLLAGFKDKVGESVDVSDSSKLLEALSGSLTEDAPESPSLLNTYNDQRQKLGVGALEDSLTTIDNQMAKLDADNKALQENNDNRVEAVSQINRRKSADQINYEKAKNDLTLQRNTIANQLNQKYSVIDNIVKYTSADAQTATQEYTDKFNKAITLTNLIKNVQDDAKSDAERAQDNARANATLMINTLSGKNVDFSKMDAATTASLSNLELNAGLPNGFIKFALTSTDQPVVSIGSEFTDASGNRQVPVYTKNPSTGVLSTKVVTIGTDSGAVDKTKNLDKDIQTIVADFTDTMIKQKWRGVDPTMYQDYRQQIFDQYGSSGVTKLDAAIKAAKLIVDYGPQSDAAFAATKSSNDSSIDPTTGLPNWLVGK